jgi:hypothetical protein
LLAVECRWRIVAILILLRHVPDGFVDVVECPTTRTSWSGYCCCDENNCCRRKMVVVVVVGTAGRVENVSVIA